MEKKEKRKKLFFFCKMFPKILQSSATKFIEMGFILNGKRTIIRIRFYISLLSSEKIKIFAPKSYGTSI